MNIQSLGMYMGENKFWGPLPHWNNFTLPELREILWHIEALERIGIAQNETIAASIKRDIALRDKKHEEQDTMDVTSNIPQSLHNERL
jgi:hypothetical protein